MPAFEALPFDVFFELGKFLNLDDAVHLSQTCRQLKAHLLDNQVARQVVEVSITEPYKPTLP
jgi:hypothetical protein